MTIARPLFFAAEQDFRCRAALARDLAASAPDTNMRKRHLREAERLEGRIAPQLDAYLYDYG